MKTLEKTIVGATAPTNKNVLWIDSKNNLIKYNNNNKWLRTSNHSDDTLDVFLPRTGGTMKGNIDMNGKRIDNIGIEEVNSLPTTNYEGRMVKFKNKTYTFYNGLWLALSDDLRGHANDTHEENFIYQPTAADLSVKDGFADIKKLKGNTVVWNQLNDNTGWTAGSGASFEKISEGVYKITSYASLYNKDLRKNVSSKIHTSHKYLIIGKVSANYTGVMYVILSYKDNMVTKTYNVENNTILIKSILTPSFNADLIRFSIDFVEAIADRSLQVSNIQLIDLTLMFGEGNEPATVEEFEAMFPNDYYEYNEGKLLSFSGKGIKSVGFNAFDGEKAKVLKGQKYYLGGTYTYLEFKENENSEAVAFELPSDRYYTPATNGYIVAEGTDICINLSHSGYHDGEYEPYEDYTALFQDGNTISQLTGKLNGEGDSVVIFPDGLRSAGEAFDEIVYDEAIGKWKAVKRIGSVDMGTLNWLKNNIGYGDNVFILNSDQVDNINMARNANANSLSNMLSVNYYPSLTYSLAELDNAIAGPFSKSTSKGALMIKNTSYTDAESFKQSLQGQILYYELAEPEVYELDFPINTSYEAYDFGTEEVLYSDDKEVNIPMKANIEYGFNAVDMIRNNFEEIRSLKERVTALEQAIQLMQSNNILE